MRARSIQLGGVGLFIACGSIVAQTPGDTCPPVAPPTQRGTPPTFLSCQVTKQPRGPSGHQRWHIHL